MEYGFWSEVEGRTDCGSWWVVDTVQWFPELKNWWCSMAGDGDGDETNSIRISGRLEDRILASTPQGLFVSAVHGRSAVLLWWGSRGVCIALVGTEEEIQVAYLDKDSARWHSCLPEGASSFSCAWTGVYNMLSPATECMSLRELHELIKRWESELFFQSSMKDIIRGGWRTWPVPRALYLGETVISCRLQAVL